MSASPSFAWPGPDESSPAQVLALDGPLIRLTVGGVVHERWHHDRGNVEWAVLRGLDGFVDADLTVLAINGYRLCLHGTCPSSGIACLFEKHGPGGPSTATRVGAPLEVHTTNGEVPVSRCRSFHAGHGAHYIQARKSLADSLRRPCRIVGLAADGSFQLDIDGDVVVAWHHDPEVVARALVRKTPAQVDVRFRILQLPDRTLSISFDGPSPCAGRFCEICGADAHAISEEGWDCCNVHVHAPKPAVPLVHRSTGQAITDPTADPVQWRREVRELEEAVEPIAHLDFPTDGLTHDD